MDVTGSKPMSHSSRCARFISISAVALVTVVGCSSSPDDGDVAWSSEALTMPASLCGKAAIATIDDIPAYPNDCGNVNVWSNDGRTTKTAPGTGTGWVQTEGGYGYQCTELASRYMHFRFGTATHWGIAEAKDMCATHPTDVSKTSSPVEGDLMVFAPGVCVGAAGHVAVVSSVTSTTASVVQQNETANGVGTYKRTCASCFLHAARNNVCGDAANGAHCGAVDGFGGKSGTLYVCKSYAVESSTVCADGCNSSDAGSVCASADAGDDASDEDASITKTEDAAIAPPEADAASAPTAVTNGGGCAAAPLEKNLDARAGLLSLLGLFVLARRRRD
jgi:hypothetical protein